MKPTDPISLAESREHRDRLAALEAKFNAAPEHVKQRLQALSLAFAEKLGADVVTSRNGPPALPGWFAWYLRIRDLSNPQRLALHSLYLQERAKWNRRTLASLAAGGFIVEGPDGYTVPPPVATAWAKHVNATDPADIVHEAHREGGFLENPSPPLPEWFDRFLEVEQLSPAQRRTLGAICNATGARHNARTVAVLLRRGLVVATGGSYAAPLPVQAAWSRHARGESYTEAAAAARVGP